MRINDIKEWSTAVVVSLSALFLFGGFGYVIYDDIPTAGIVCGLLGIGSSVFYCYCRICPLKGVLINA